jgi:hypothetical protein
MPIRQESCQGPWKTALQCKSVFGLYKPTFEEENSQNVERLPCPAGDPQPYDPCIDNEVEVYLNNPAVQAAIHANTTGTVPGPWQDCSDRVQYSEKDFLSSMIPVWKSLVKSGVRLGPVFHLDSFNICMASSYSAIAVVS